MKNTYLILTIIIFTVTVNNLVAQYNKNLYMVHGLGGNSTSFINFSGAVQYGTAGFSSRKINVFSDIDYGNIQTYGLTNSADRVLEQIATKSNAYTNPLNSFIISHSQGGIVSRKADQRIGGNSTLRTFGGVVTIGTPNGGAMILNNLDSKMIPLANESCNTLLKVSISNLLTKGGILKDLIYPFTRRLQFSVPNAVCDAAFPNTDKLGIIDIVAGHFTSAITESYKVGATDLNDLNAFHQNNSTNLNKALFYGVKDNADIFWRVLHYFKNSPNDVPAFQASNDNQSVLDGQAILMDYESALAAQRLGFSNCGFLGTNWCWTSQQYRDKIAALDQAVVLVKNLNNRWLDAIGAASYTYSTNSTCYCVSPYGGSFTFPTTGSCPETSGGSYSCTTQSSITSYTQTIKPSDGVVLVESQIAFPGVDASKRREMPNNSHMQERNSPELRNAANALFDGQLGQFFYVQKNQ